MTSRIRKGRSLFSIVLSILLLTVWMVPSSVLPVGAAPTPLNVRYRFNTTAQAHELYWASPTQPGQIAYSWHDVNGTTVAPPPQSLPDDPLAPNPIYRYVTENGVPTVVLRVPFVSDHVYDMQIAVYSDAGVTQIGAASPYVLVGMTFEAESFDQSANTLIETEPLLEDMNGNSVDYPGPASKVISGQNPGIRLRWKVPTVFVNGDIRYMTETASNWRQETLDPLRSGIQKTLPIESAGFYFTMNKGRNTTVPLEFKTYWDGAALQMGGATVGSTPLPVTGLDAQGKPGPSGFVEAVLEKANGIESGTEYQNLRTGLTLSTTDGAPLLFVNTNLQAGTANAFPGVNTDVAFEEYGPLTSVFTPMEYEMAKVDTDKVEVRFRRVVNGVYTQLYYEIQDLSGNDLNFPNASEVRGNWITIPDSSLAPGTLYGSVILPFAVVNGELPERYVRVVASEQGAPKPRNSTLVNSLTLLGGQTGRPALPQNLTVEAKYGGLGTVSPGGVDVEIPTSTLVLTFDKPSVWSTYNGAAWEDYRDDPQASTDPVFNILLSTLLPDVPEAQIKDSRLTLSDAVNTVTVQNPVRQKRALVIGKEQLSEVPGNPNRLTVELDGTRLFHDYATPIALTAENNEVGTRGPYPTFLIPNLTYYLQVFTARFEYLDDINTAVWADRGNGGDGLPANLKEVISYSSPLYSFTTWPIREVPVPLPNLSLSVEPALSAVPDTGKMELNGIRVSHNHILQEQDWKRYLSTEQWNLYDTGALNDQNRRRVELSVEYQFYISDKPPASALDFQAAGITEIFYPTTGEPQTRLIRSIPDTDPNVHPEPGSVLILPNTTYYIKAHPYLNVYERADGQTDVTPTRIGYTMDTSVKTITTPKLDLVSLDNITRNPRAPAEFSVATDAAGNDLVTDASMVMQWMHRESDVGYELMVTSVIPQPNDSPDLFADDPHLLDLLTEYRTRTPQLVSGNTLWIPLQDAAARAAMQTGHGLVFDEEILSVLLPLNGFLQPNTQYYVSLRAIRNRGIVDADGKQNPPPSRWVTVPVTTPMVKAPEGLEIVRDIEAGFTVTSTLGRGDPANFEVYMKRTNEPESAYTLLSRARYTLVRDGATYYWRVGGLSSDTWYDFRLRHIPPDAKWYDATSGTWKDTVGEPVTVKTRDALHEIEVRWIGEAAYQYFLEARAESEVDYVRLQYVASGISDLGYETEDGLRTQYYTDRTAAQVSSGSIAEMYYARILRKRTLQADGALLSVPLKTNGTYAVRLWARNPAVVISDGGNVLNADSIHVGPVSTRTDFSQVDYDLEKDRENIVNLYDDEAEQLTKKPYWLVDKGANNAVRVLLKGDRVQAMLESSPGSTSVISLETELPGANLYEITIPEQVLETLRRADGRLLLRVEGAEYLLSRSSFNLPELKASVTSTLVKETMLRIRIQRADTPPVPLASLYGQVSKAYFFTAEAIGSRYDKTYLEAVIGKILNDPLAKGPFRYGLLDRERTALETNASAYTYRVHTDLADTVRSLVDRVEGQMSRYLKDLLDGGSGVATFSIQKAAIAGYPGSVLVSQAYAYDNGRTVPLILPAGASSWKEPSGMRAFSDSMAAFRIDGPSTTVIGSSKGVQGSTGITWPGLTAIAGRYDLSHAFGTKPVYPSNTITGREAVLLYEVLSGQIREAQGLSMAQKLELLALEDVIATRTLLLPLDNQRAVSWNVQLYAKGTGRDMTALVPVATPQIANLSAVLPALQKPVVLGLDLGLVRLPVDKQFDAAGTASLGALMEMANKVLTLLGR